MLGFFVTSLGNVSAGGFSTILGAWLAFRQRSIWEDCAPDDSRVYPPDTDQGERGLGLCQYPAYNRLVKF